MAVAISIQFLTGRFHATPWDKQVNEGVVEWPPSPWRILRSLVAAYYRLPELPDRATLNQLMTHLAETPPSYVLPAVTAAHTRHYMPLWKNGEATTTKVLDTFYALPGGALSAQAVVQVVWPDLDLGGEDLGLLRSLCAGVGYLGRAESWVDLLVVDTAIKPNVRPIADESKLERGESVVRVLVPLNQQEMNGFVTAMKALPSPKKGRNWWESPADVLGALEVDIGALHRQGWHGIPGSQWVLYGMESVQPAVVRRSAVKSLEGMPAIARFALSGKLLPRITAALSVGERLHQALMVWSRDEDGLSAQVFSGRDGNQPLARNHDHAWYLPECNARGAITHVVVYSRCGFEARAVKALQGIRQVWGSEGFDIGVDLVSLVRFDDATNVTTKRQLVTGRSRVWRSLTPFVLTRFPKRKAIAGSQFLVDGPEDQALRLLRLLRLDLDRADGIKRVEGDWLCWGDAGGERLVRVRCVDRNVLDVGRDELRYPFQRFQRQRLHGQGQRSLGQGFWLEIEFAAAVRGPIALGYGAHFGLGVLVSGAEG